MIRARISSSSLSSFRDPHQVASIGGTIYLRPSPLLARHVLHINVSVVTAPSNHHRYLVKCAAAFGRASKRAICPSYCAVYPRRAEREPIRYRDRCSTRSQYSDGTIARGDRDRELVVQGAREVTARQRRREGGQEGGGTRCEVIWGVVESSRQCCVF